MNRSLLLPLLLFFSTVHFCAAQDYGICIQVVSSGGKSGTQGNYSLSWTVGESVITTIGASGYILTQGFHQPDVCVPVSTHNLDLAEWAIEVFPIPTADFLTVRFSDEKSGNLEASVFDLLGRTVLANTPLDQAHGTLLDCTSWQAGVYFLHLRDLDSRAVATVRFIRL